LEWDVGGFWIVNELRMVLECAAFYSPTPDSFKNFETVSRARHFTFGEGLPGSAWKTRSVVCFPNVSKEENFPRLSVAALRLWRQAQLAERAERISSVVSLLKMTFAMCGYSAPIILSRQYRKSCTC